MSKGNSSPKINPLVSIIIVNYKVEKELLECISSIYKENVGIRFEIIVVDNDEKEIISKNLLSAFPKVRYIKSPGNIGFGAGNNLGVQASYGEYVFFLNPDTLLHKDCIKNVVTQIRKNKRIGIVAPLLYDSSGNVYPLQGSLELTPLRGMIVLSWINKIFPNNSVSKKFWLRSWNKKDDQSVDAVPGTAFLMEKKLFEEVGGFDETFFLYFEENDLCKRIKKKGFKLVISPRAGVTHHWGRSTDKSRSNIQKIFLKSRYYYFRKNYGLFAALGVEAFLRIGIYEMLIGSAVIIGLVLRIYLLNENFFMIPDGGWFYLSARDMLLTGNIPLVGPPTSHPWIHHGPLWTYTLAVLLWIFRFDPVAPAYFMACVGVVMIYIIYRLGSLLFSKKAGIASAFLLASSPIFIRNAQNPYHTSPIPLFSLLLVYFLYKWISTNRSFYFPILMFLVGVLYNHEITTVTLSAPVFFILFYGLIKKHTYALQLLRSKKWLVLSFLALSIPMTPFVLYDMRHGFHQTVGFAVWLVYRVLRIPLAIINPPQDNTAMTITHPEFSYFIKSLFFAPNIFISLAFLLLALFFPILLLLKKKKRTDKSVLLLSMYVSIPLLGLFIHRVPIEADVMIVAPFFLLSLGLIISKLMDIKKYFLLGVCLLFSVFFFNSYSQVDSAYRKTLLNKRRPVPVQIAAAEEIVRLSHGREYNLIGKGVLDNFPVFTMPYEYLAWWKGNGPVKENRDLKIVVSPNANQISVYIKSDEK